jgi:hypothetical protein
MSKERAIALLRTAKILNDPEDIKRFVESAINKLDPETDIVPGIEMAVEMIESSLLSIRENAPDWQDTVVERAQKLSIVEAELGQIKEYASQGAKIRYQAALDNAEGLKKARMNRSLGDYEDRQLEKIPGQRIPEAN